MTLRPSGRRFLLGGRGRAADIARGQHVGHRCRVVRALAAAALCAAATLAAPGTAGASSAAPLVAASASPSVCDRTAQVRDAIVAAVSGKTACADINSSDLAAITKLDIESAGITALTAGDFNGLSKLTQLYASNNSIASLPAGILHPLSSLQLLYLSGNQLTSLPPDTFKNSSFMYRLHLENNRLTSLPPDIFKNATRLMQLYVDDNRLTSLPAGIFDTNTWLQYVLLMGNELSSLPTGLFAKNTALKYLRIGYNRFGTLPASLFSTNTSLQSLYIGGSQYSSKTDSWTQLDGHYKGASLVLPNAVFSGLSSLRHLSLDHAGLRCLPTIPSNVTKLKLDEDVTSDRARTALPSCSGTGRLPPAPTGVTVASASSTSATLSWTLPTGTWTDIDARWRSVGTDNSTVSAWSSKNVTGASITSTTVTGLTASTTYQFEVRVNNATHDGLWSQRVSLPPGKGPNVSPPVVVSEAVVTVAEHGDTATYTVALATKPTANVTVTPASDTTSAATVSGALTFTADNWSTAQTVTVTGVNDSTDNSGSARFATIAHAVAGGNYATVSAPSVSVVVTDEVLVSATSVSVAENAGTAAYTVVLGAEPTANVTVTPASSNTSAATVSSALTFTTDNWDTPQTVTITGVNDDNDNPGNTRSATVTHTVSSTDSDYSGVSPADVAVSVADDDANGVVLSATAVTVAEDAGTATYTVVLAAEPTATVTVTPASNAAAAAAVSGALTFTADNWSSAQQVTVTGVNDDNDNPGNARSATVTHAVAGGNYANVNAPSVSVTITDDDASQSQPGGNDGNDGGSPTGGTGGGGGGSGAARPERLSGADRWATAAAVSNKLVELLEAADPATGARTQVDTVIVASGHAFPDALTAAALSKTLRAPLLLTSKTRLEQPVRAFIARHRPTTAVIVGGPAAVSTDVEAELLAMNEIGTVTRHAGADRYDTAAKIAAAVGGPARLCGTAKPTVIVTTGRNYPDALVAGPLAYRGPHPILLTEPHTLPDPIRAWLADSAAKHAIVIGGTKAVSDGVLEELRGLGLTTERLSGADRAHTSVTVARRLTSLVGTSGCFRKDTVGLATGWAFPDALAAAPLLGRYGAPLLLTSPNGVPQPLIDYFAAGLLEPDFDLPPITTIGGRTAVPTAHQTKLLANLPR